MLFIDGDDVVDDSRFKKRQIAHDDHDRLFRVQGTDGMDHVLDIIAFVRIDDVDLRIIVEQELFRLRCCFCDGCMDAVDFSGTGKGFYDIGDQGFVIQHDARFFTKTHALRQSACHYNNVQINPPCAIVKKISASDA